MLALPEKGIATSSTKHNCDLISFIDWWIGSVLFFQNPISKSDAVDFLTENLIYEDQDFCFTFIDIAIEKIRLFLSSSLTQSISIFNDSISPAMDWEDDPILSFCLLASFRSIYPQWSKQNAGDYNTQGYLWERISQHALSTRFKDWKFHKTGKSATEKKIPFSVIAANIAENLSTVTGDLNTWDHPRVNELGLDLYGYMDYGDNRIKSPVLLVQCATGDNWQEKRKTPDLDIWKEVIKFSAEPLRGMAIPFLIEDPLFKQSTTIIKGPLFERSRILASSREALPVGLKDEVLNWSSPLVKELPINE